MKFPLHLAALTALLLAPLPLAAQQGQPPPEDPETLGRAHGHADFAAGSNTLNRADLERLLHRLTSDEYEGRGTGLRGEILATAHAAAYFEDAGLEPAGDDGTWYQAFPFRAGYKLTGDNHATLDWGHGVLQHLVNKSTYTPVSFSPDGTVPNAPLTFAGFGIVTDDYDSYAGLDVSNRWVMVLRGNPSARGQLSRFGPLIQKAAIAKKRGAVGIIFVKAGNEKIPAELIQLRSVGQRGRILPAIAIRNELADQLLGDRKLDEVYTAYDKAEQIGGFHLTPRLAAAFSIKANESAGRNVLARLPCGKPDAATLVLGAHIDHLGFGNRGGSRAKGKQREALHPGADDNASGTVAILAIARELAARVRADDLTLEHDIVFAAFSGEEMGLYGSRHFVKQHQQAGTASNLLANLNLDMIGRLRNNTLHLNGTGTSPAWSGIVAQVSEAYPFTLKRNPNQGASDAKPFDDAKIPSLFAITGTHPDYHTPADTFDKINLDGMTEVTHFVRDLTLAIATNPQRPPYRKPPATRNRPPAVVIGIVPEESEDGVRLVSISDDSPASRAGLQIGDHILSLADKRTPGLEELLNVIRTLKPNREIPVRIRRDGEDLDLKLTPAKR